MDTPQSLLVIAEISIAFAGFSGLLVALRRKAGPLTAIQKFRLQVLLSLAFGALFLSLLPDMLQHLGATPATIWRLASLFVLSFSFGFVVWWVRTSRRVSRTAPEIFHRFAFARMAAGHVVVASLQAAVVLAFITESAPGVYLVALVWYLLHATQQFTRILFVQPRADTADT